MPTAREASAHQRDVLALNWMAHVSEYCEDEHSSAGTPHVNWKDSANAEFRGYKMDLLSIGGVLDSVISGPAVYQT